MTDTERETTMGDDEWVIQLQKQVEKYLNEVRMTDIERETTMGDNKRRNN